ncbi:MAG: DUF4921 family protein [Patescibacteria group bacterium]
MVFKKNKILSQGFVSELRQDFISGDWVLVASGRVKRPQDFFSKKKKIPETVSACPFESARINGEKPLLWYPHPDAADKDSPKNWFVQVVANKYPALALRKERSCAMPYEYGIYKAMSGVGYHEVIVTRPHDRSLGKMTAAEAALVVRSYRDRYAALDKDPCIAYILVFHNHGAGAGASIMHPHSQLIALPIVPPDVQRSFDGSHSFFKRTGKCIHCKMIEWELNAGERVVYENEDFVALAPYASRVSFELRIYPKYHDPHFNYISEERITTCAEILSAVLRKLYTALQNPDYNFFIHTSPANIHNGAHYHWHIEILPKTSIPAGLELGTGVDVVVVAPEEVPKILIV